MTWFPLNSLSLAPRNEIPIPLCSTTLPVSTLLVESQMATPLSAHRSNLQERISLFSESCSREIPTWAPITETCSMEFDQALTSLIPVRASPSIRIRCRRLAPEDLISIPVSPSFTERLRSKFLWESTSCIPRQAPSTAISSIRQLLTSSSRIPISTASMTKSRTVTSSAQMVIAGSLPSQCKQTFPPTEKIDTPGV